MVQRVGLLLLFALALGILTSMLMGKIPGRRPVSVVPSGLHASCTTDADCPALLACQVLEEMGSMVVYPEGYTGDRPPQQSKRTILKAECRATEGVWCRDDEDCLNELVCHQVPSGDKLCAPRRGGSCGGPADTSCPDGYTCIQGCGPPLARGDEPPPPYYCEVNEVARQPRNCPICLASHTLIAAPHGDIPVEDVRAGMTIWSLSENGERIAVQVVQTVRTPVSTNHHVMRLVLSDGRIVRVSAGHPLASGIPVERLQVGGYYDGSKVIGNDPEPYEDDATYDILPAGKTGTYWANGILLKSTLE